MNWMFILIALLFGLVVWMCVIEPRWYRIRHVTIRGFKKLSHPLTILHLTDIHFRVQESHKRRFFQKLSMMNPDLLVITGDTIEDSDGIKTAASLLSGIRARYGAFLVLGNHDYYSYSWLDNLKYHVGLSRVTAVRNDTDAFQNAMNQVGIRVLKNHAVHLNVHGNELAIGGTDDPITQQVDFQAILKPMSPKTFNLLLTHHLDSLLKLSHHGMDLVLAGHTHGGQIRIPFLGSIVNESKIGRRYMDGLNVFNDIQTFVSRGIGTGRVLIPRLACRPEAVWFHLSN